jgi:hypothetical protein
MALKLPRPMIGKAVLMPDKNGGSGFRHFSGGLPVFARAALMNSPA